MIWKKCSGHKVVEFKTGRSMHHYQSSKKLLQSISYEFIERHLRKADKLQRNYYICESSKLEIYPCLSLLIPLLPTTSLHKGKNSFFHSELQASLPWSSASVAAGDKSSLKFSSGVYRKVARGSFSAMARSIKSEGINSEQPEMASTWEAWKAT